MSNIELTVDRHVAVVTVNRPPVNAFTREMYQEAIALFDGLNTNVDVSVAILTGAGEKAFCAGNDVSEFLAQDLAGIMLHNRLLEGIFHAIYRCEVPVIGAINGPALGTGMSLCASCDVLIATPNATFGIPEITVGSIGGTRYLMRLLPQQKARWMALTGERITAEEMYRLGALEKIVPRAELLPTALAMARRILDTVPTPGIRLQKRSLNEVEFLSLDDGNRTEHHYSEQLRLTPDSQEAARAFFEKRRPRFSGAE